jgi:hypothetical protein
MTVVEHRTRELLQIFLTRPTRRECRLQRLSQQGLSCSEEVAS